ncbi:uncharacterized protein LOC122075722 isoform X2 [Macadamia integrifolia]|uniref:uncharacterized protein LOC122075722 isoform X2 n=1 Tax=Macadamia integrifolia TaxID=60698 RepID=UPI001C4F33FF|nr:uncharacterized protein LOC122075722 isoform X2 [Macadamia integrifolia]
MPILAQFIWDQYTPDRLHPLGLSFSFFFQSSPKSNRNFSRKFYTSPEMAHQQLLPLPIQRPCLLPCNTINSSQRACTAHKPILVHCLCSGSGGDTRNTPAKIKPEEIPPNALRRKMDPLWRGGFSLGVDMGMSRTGLALGKVFSPRPLSVLEFRGNKLELRLLEIAEREFNTGSTGAAPRQIGRRSR